MATLQHIVERLAKVHLFSRLDRPQLQALAKKVKQVEYGPGRVVYRQGDIGESYFVVDTGRLHIVRVDAVGQVQEVRELGPGEAVGETSLLLGDVRDTTVETLEPSLLLVIERADWLSLLKEHPEIEKALLMRKDVAERRAYPRFAWLQEGELPIKVLVKHKAILFTTLLLPASIGFFLLTFTILSSILLETTLPLVLGLIPIVILLLICIYLYIDWRNDLYIITNRRVSHYERIGLIHVDQSVAPLQAIQNISQVRVGMLPNVLGYGDLIMEMTGEGGQVIFRSIPNPDQVQTIILEQIERTQARARAEERDTIHRALRRHLLGTDGGAEETVPQKPKEGEKQRSLLLRVLASLLPPTWHREGKTVTWRKHWIGLIRPIGLPLLLFIAVTALMIFLTDADVLGVGSPAGVLLLVYAIVVMVLVPWMMWQFEDWQNDFYQVTATRLIHVDRAPFFLREERRESPLDRITNVRFEQSIIGKLFGYGDMVVETAAVGGDFNLCCIARPEDVQKEIFAHMSAYRESLRRQETERRRAEILDWFSVYDEIRHGPPPTAEPEGAS